MSKVKIRFGIIIALVIAFIFAIGFSIGSLFSREVVSAITYEPTKIFSAHTGSTVTAYKTGTAEEDKAYVGFSMKQDGSEVRYFRNLAFKWYERDDSENYEGNLANPGKEQYFSLRFSFPAINFESFELIFESDEENVTKSGKSTNKLAFSFVTENGYNNDLKVVLNKADNKENSRLTTKESWVTDWSDVDFILSFKKGKTAGEFALSLVYTDGTNTSKDYFDFEDEGNDGDKTNFAFTNIGNNFAEYRSVSSSKPNTPLTFKVNFAKPAEGEEATGKEQKVLVKELNGQSLEVKNYSGADGAQAGDDGLVAITGGNVEDTKAPALVLNETVYAFTLGQRYSLTHNAIDVLDDTVQVTRRYYIAKKGDDGKFVAPDESKTDDYKSLTTSVFFMPLDDTVDDEIYISIRFELTDGRTKAEGENDYVYLSWYADESAVATENGWDYVKAVTEKQDPEYTVVKPNPNPDYQNNEKQLEYDTIVGNYQTLVEEAAKKTSAGEGAYIYLPSLRDLIGSSSADYRNLKFSVYYYTQRQSETASPLSETSLSYNNLKIPVNVEGDYIFRVLATDADGNAIQLYNDNKELVDVTGSNIFDIEGIPEFRFSVGYDGATVEDSGEQTPGYRETSYTVSSFKIVALSGYETDYTLYYFDESLLDGATVPSYSDLVKNIQSYMEDKEYLAYQKCMDQIQEYNSEYTEDDEEWESTDNDYHWNPSSALSFNPQRSGFYVVQATVTDPHYINKTVNGYQVIEIRNPLDVTPGRSNWLENNRTSVILFSISGVLAIAIVVLLVVKPSEKTPEDIDLDKLKGKKKNNAKKN